MELRQNVEVLRSNWQSVPAWWGWGGGAGLVVMVGVLVVVVVGNFSINRKKGC